MATITRRPPRRVTAAAVAAVATGLLVAGCATTDDAAPASTSTTVPRATPTTARTTPTTAAGSSMRGKRYCEVLLVQPADGTVRAEVYNSFPLNDCPESKWSQLDTAAIAATAGVRVAVLNGPRYWLMDRVEKVGGSADLPRSTFGGIDMYRMASVDVGSMANARVPYRENTVDRRTLFVFDAGRTVYELRAPDGATYVMQTWSQQKDRTLTEADLTGLGSRLTLPTGWTYRARRLAEPLEVDTRTAPARVIQDDLENSYSRVTAG